MRRELDAGQIDSLSRLKHAAEQRRTSGNDYRGAASRQEPMPRALTKCKEDRNGCVHLMHTIFFNHLKYMTFLSNPSLVL